MTFFSKNQLFSPWSKRSIANCPKWDSLKIAITMSGHRIKPHHDLRKKHRDRMDGSRDNEMSHLSEQMQVNFPKRV